MMAVPQVASNSILSEYETFIFDADGVLWRANEAVDGAPELVKFLIESGKRVFILTNNPTNTIDGCIKKAGNLGFVKLEPENIVNSAIVTAHEINQHKAADDDRPVYLIGSHGLKLSLEENGIKTFGFGPELTAADVQTPYIYEVDISVKPSAVVVSFDIHYNYVKLMKAISYLKDPKIPCYITNEDESFPSKKPGIICPGLVCISTAVRAGMDREPIVIGKPHTPMFNYISSKHQIDPSQTLMIGDNCHTDIAFGARNGLDTLLVLTGVHKLSDVEKFVQAGNNELVPKMFANSVKDLLLE